MDAPTALKPGDPHRPQPRSRTGARHRSRRHGRLALDRPRQEERSRRRGGRGDAPGVRRRCHRGHRGDRRGRDGRGADAVHRREGRLRRPEDGHRRRPAGGHHPDREGRPPALAVVALAEHGNFLHAPDIYMDKIAVGGGLPDGVVDLDAAVAEQSAQPGQAKRCDVSDLVACILDRDRHKELIAQCARPARASC